MKNAQINFCKGKGMVPVIIQDDISGVVYMLGYMNKEALNKTRDTGWVYFWSRSRKRLWIKGEESGNKLNVKEILVDCDNDTLLVKAELKGKRICHSGNITCFNTKL